MWLHHATHARCTAHRHSRLLLGLVANEALGGEEHTGNRSGVLQSNTSHLGRIDDASLAQVLVLVQTGIVTEVSLALTNLLYDNGTFLASIADNLTQRLLDGTADDIDTRLLVGIVTLYAGQSLLSTDIGRTTTGNDTFLDGCTGSAESIVNAILLLLHLYLAVSTYVEYCYATCQFGKTLLQLLLV